MLQRALDDVSDDFHVAMRMASKTLAARNEILIDHAQSAESHVLLVEVSPKGEGVVRIQPAMIGVAAVCRFANGEHRKHPLNYESDADTVVGFSQHLVLGCCYLVTI